MHYSELFESTIPKPWEAKFKAAGYRRIGRGSMAQVWAKSGDPYVIKIFRSDEAYLEFVKLIQAHQDNPHFPQTKGRLVNVRGFRAIRIERLARLTPSEMIEKMQNYRSAHNAFKYGFKNDTLPSYIEEMTVIQHEFRQQYPQLADALDLIFTQICDPRGWSVDWTEGNFRMRGKTVVITDPVAW